MELSDVKFSVLLPVLERSDITKGLPFALNSIFQNTIKPDQVVMTIDGLFSKDFELFIKTFEKKYNLDVIWINKKVGLDNALNLGISKCRNEFIFRADGDDINLKNRFEEQLPYLINGFDVVGSDIDEYDEFGEYLCTKTVPYSNKEISKTIFYRNPINHMTVAFKKKVVSSVNGYPKLFLKGDYGLWIKLHSKKYKFINLKKSLVKATTGSRMIKDRGGLRYVLSEFNLQIFLLANGETNIIYSILIFILRSLIFILPVSLRYIFYMRFLRRK
ncbi:glycosyltransferase [uncultured Prochlorococcus sp.]|uniref:glycosyltransferase n=1 Tax=uncultured Prochlorococcus sp. TaxID=159733 RepID=UPI00258EBC40|nr:glycosyltransferase [uncultured Prochlorococcus sp.]